MAGKPTPVGIGARSGQLEVVEEFHNGKLWQVRVRCDCGNEKVINKNNFTSGKTTTCGCGPRGKPFDKIHGYGGTPVYNSWKKMMDRCYKPEDPYFKDYGGRGITVCERWHDVVNFVADMGERVIGLSIERINTNGNYEPANCCWLPVGLQSSNRRPWQHTPEGIKAIADSRKRDWQNGVYDDKVKKQRQ